ncbi:MAG TPA: hypothetical protein VNT75_03850 [Symbiobacteriaceae bacterium]|nr:hypothetical protein [Symbiobacteriaceae bacterium]
MAWRPTDQLVTERVQKYVYPGENRYVQGFASEQPSWGWILLIGTIATFFYKYYAIGVKETGLIITELSMWGYGEKSAVIIPWNSIFNVTYNPGMIQDILSFQSADGRQWNLRFQKVFGLTDNREAGKTLAQYVYGWSQAVQQQQGQ